MNSLLAITKDLRFGVVLPILVFILVSVFQKTLAVARWPQI